MTSAVKAAPIGKPTPTLPIWNRVDLLDGQYHNPVRVVAFNMSEGWSHDVSADIAQELRRRCDLQLRDVPSSIQDFVERHEAHHRQFTLRLA